MEVDLLRQAVSERWKSMIRKWPAIVFAALACYGLYYLDQVKQSFDEEKARPILVDEKFKERLKSEFQKQGPDAINKWEEIQGFIHVSQYSTADDFINKVVARISRANEPKDFVAQATFRGCVARALTPPAEESKSESSAALDIEKCSTDYIAYDEGSYRNTQDKIASVYHYLKNVPLKKIDAELAGRQERQGFFQALLGPTLDDQSGLHIIYQILRISFVVIIVFALLAVVALLLRTLMLSDGVKTVTDQATSLIGPGRSPILPVGRAAVMTVAALGLGTAVAAGVSINNKADQALAQYQRPAPEPGKPAARVKGAYSPPESSGTPAAHYDSTNTQYDYAYDNGVYDYSTHQEIAGSTPQPPVVKVYPQITVNPVLEKGGNPGNTSVSLDPASVESIKTALTSLTAVNQDLSTKLKNLTPSTSTDEIKVANHVTKDALDNSVDKALLIELQGKSTFDNTLKSLQDFITKFDDLHSINLDKPANPTERSGIGSLFHGPDRYFVSKRALEQIADLMNGYATFYNGEKQKLSQAATDTAYASIQNYDAKLAADAAISEAMRWLYLRGGVPVKKEEFIKKLKIELQQTSYYQQNQSMVLGRFSFWQDTILTYTRIR
ncbi:MAG TPA: hypothetical protein VFS90_02055 [Pyrinomonadaceae bacterium]|nr:hypothetical protein [Pyrinomonadaceae bacterium]